jgi:hypothetical protein
MHYAPGTLDEAGGAQGRVQSAFVVAVQLKTRTGSEYPRVQDRTCTHITAQQAVLKAAACAVSGAQSERQQLQASAV